MPTAKPTACGSASTKPGSWSSSRPMRTGLLTGCGAGGAIAASHRGPWSSIEATRGNLGGVGRGWQVASLLSPRAEPRWPERPDRVPNVFLRRAPFIDGGSRSRALARPSRRPSRIPRVWRAMWQRQAFAMAHGASIPQPRSRWHLQGRVRRHSGPLWRPGRLARVRARPRTQCWARPWPASRTSSRAS